jgi:hypothetical protein
VNTTSRLLLLCGVLTLAACGKNYPEPKDAVFARHQSVRDPGPLAACPECKWEAVLGKSGPVSYLGCISPEGKPAHCHLRVADSEPARSGVVNKSGDHFTFSLTTTGDSGESIECERLDLASDDHVIWTKEKLCLIREPNIQQGEEHHFGAKIEKTADDKYLIRFVFQHDEFSDRNDPIHNGEGHIHPPN